MTFTIPSEIEFVCPKCQSWFKLLARSLAGLTNLTCPVCTHAFFWLDGVKQPLQSEIRGQVKETLRDLVVLVKDKLKQEQQAVDEEVLSLLLRRIVHEK